MPRAPFRQLAFLRPVIATALVGYLLWHANPRAVAQEFATARWPPLVVVVALVLLDRALMAYRWWVLLRPLDRERLPPFGAVMRIFFVSTFAGTFLPGSIGGDAVRAYSLSTLGVPVGDSMASVFVDRMLGVLSLFLMAVLGLALATDLASDRAIRLGLMMTGAACVVAAALVFSRTVEGVAERLLARAPWEPLRRMPMAVLASIRRYADHHRPLANVLAASVAVQMLRVLQAYYLGAAIGLSQPLVVYFAFIPLILLVMLLPITVNGVGTSQAAFVWFFAHAQMPAHEAFALSVLFLALQIVGNLPGALLVGVGAVSGAAPPRRTS